VSTILTDIVEALYAGAKLATADIGQDWENMGYEPKEGTPYARMSLPVNFVDPGMGVDGLNQHRGIFEISLFYPLGAGVLPMRRKADAIAGILGRGSEHIFGSAKVRVESISPGGLIYDKAWAQLPLNIKWRCHAGN
jgi:hypothetical protein